MEFSRKIDSLLSTRLFHYKNVFILGSGFIALVILSNITVKFIYRNYIEFDCPVFWPMSMFFLRLPDWREVLFAMAVFILFLLAARHLVKIRCRIPHVILTGIILVLATNLIQGWENGFMNPVSGGGENGIQCYHDAIKIDDPYDFLHLFERKQPDLFIHSRTHPPGAVLAFYYLIKTLENPGLISIFLAAVSVSLSAFFLHGILSRELDKGDLSIYVTFLFILIPGIQIYYAATTDALISSFLLGTLYFFLHPKAATGVSGSIICLFAASLLTFGSVFILPVLLGFEIISRRNAYRSGFILSILVLIHVAVYAVSGFNYANSFLIASSLENPDGFMLFSDPASYIFTRLEGIFEIILFFGPFLLALMIRGIRITKTAGTKLSLLTVLAVSTLLAMFVAGVFRTGETARACLFIYPYLVLPIASYLAGIGISRREKTVLASLVFAQTVLMQLFGTYFW